MAKFGTIENNTRLYQIHIEQQCKYGFTDELCERLVKWDEIEEFAYIVHNQDTNDDGSSKEPHIHCQLKFKKTGVTAGALLNRCNVGFPESEPVITLNRLEWVGKNFKGPDALRWASGLAYLTHELPGCKGKHVYGRQEVKANIDIGPEIDKVLDYLKTQGRLAQIIQLISDGTINRFNYTHYITAFEYVRFKREISASFDYREQMIADSIDRDLRVMYLQGQPGHGKTNFAKDYARKLGYSVAVSSGSRDAWQDYNGEDCFILDDWRPLGWSIPDMLKMCDNHTCTSVNSRYHNKDTHNLKMLIITSVMAFDDIWNFLDGDTSESKRQLERRINLRGIVELDKITISDFRSGETVILDNPARQYSGTLYSSPLSGLASMYGAELKKDILLPSSSVDNTEKEKIIYLPDPDYHFDNPEVIKPEDIF